MIKYFFERPMLSCGIFGCLIIILGYMSNIFLLIMGVILIVSLFLCLYFRKDLKFIIILILLLFNVLSISLKMNDIKKCEQCDEQISTGSYVVTQISYLSNNTQSAVLQVSKSDVLKSGTQINVYCKNSNIELGDYIEGQVLIKAFKSNNKLYNYSKGNYLYGNIKDYSINCQKSDRVLTVFNYVKNIIKKKLFLILKHDEASTLMALVSGDKSFLSDKFCENVKRAGVSHVMVVSGMHLAIIVSFITSILELFLYNKYLKFFSILLTVLFMMCLCGYTMSIIRAGFSYLIYAVSLIIERNNTPENTLGCAVEVILIFSPLAVFNLSFLLSVLSTLGIVTVALPITDLIKKYLRIKNKISEGIISAVLISISAMIFTLPVTTFCFNYISTVSIITNILISLAVTISIVLVLCGLLISFAVPFIGDLFIRISGFIIRYVNTIIIIMGSYNLSVIQTGRGTFIISIVILLVIIAILFSCKKRVDMIKLKIIDKKIYSEGGNKIEWQ